VAIKLDRWDGADERSRDDAFAELYETSYPSLVKYCRGLLGPGTDPEEVAQEAFLRAWMTWDRYATSRPFWALVATIARNLCMDHHRHERVVSTVLEQRAGELTSTPGITPEERVEQDEEYEWARQALADLCPNHQRIINLREIEGWSADEIAAEDGTTPEAATAALYRARQRLRDAYNRVAAGALSGLAYFPLRGMRRRVGILAHYTSQATASSPGFVSHASDAVAAVVAIAVVSGAPVLNPLPQSSVPDRPAAVVAQQPQTDPGAAAIAAPGPAAAAATGGAPEASAKPATPVPVTPIVNPVIPGVLDTVAVTGVTAAPAGSKSRDVYATGTSPQACPPAQSGGSAPSNAPAACPVLFHSADGGVTWQRLKATGFAGGGVLLAPTFPTDHRIFVSGPNGLQVSSDNGATFPTVVPLSGPTAISPAFAIDHRILIGAVPGWDYRDNANTTSPLRLRNRPPGGSLTFAFSPTYAKDGQLFISSIVPGTSNAPQPASAVTTCTISRCGDPVVLDGAVGQATVLASHSFATNGVVFAWTDGSLYRSSDGGGSFKAVTLPGKGDIESVTEDPDGTLYVSLLNTDAKGVKSGGVYATHDGGKTWMPVVDGSAFVKGATSLTSIGHDRVLASPAGGGLVCSADAGKTWATHCPATS